MTDIIANHPNAVNWRNDSGATALLEISSGLPYFEQNFLKAKALIKAGANLNARGPGGETPLHRLCAYTQGYALELAHYLLVNGADPCAVDHNCVTVEMSARQWSAVMGDGFLAILQPFLR